jgi:hypothetical protein
MSNIKARGRKSTSANCVTANGGPGGRLTQPVAVTAVRCRPVRLATPTRRRFETVTRRHRG